MSRPTPLLTGLLVAALLGAAAAYYWAQARQAATLGRITALEKRLIISNWQGAKDAKNTVASIGVAVRKNHNQAKDMAVLQQAREIQLRTQDLLDTLHQLRQSWQTTNFIALRQLPKQLDQYVAFIRIFTPDAPFLTQASSRTASVGWLDTVNTTRELMPAALAQLTKLETQVQQLEVAALTYQAQRVGSWCGFDRIGAFAIPTSETVTPGTIYQAQLLLLLGTSTGRAQFSANGRKLSISSTTGQGLVQFKIPAARPSQPDTVRAAWHGRVQLPWAAGDTVLETTVPYLIVKPRPR